MNQFIREYLHEKITLYILLIISYIQIWRRNSLPSRTGLGLVFFLLITLLFSVAEVFHFEKEQQTRWATPTQPCHHCARNLAWKSHLQNGQSLISLWTDEVSEARVLLIMWISIHWRQDGVNSNIWSQG